MATISTYLRGDTSGYPAFTKAGVFKIENVIDASTYTGGWAQNDVIQALQIPAKTLVLAVGYEVTTVFDDMADTDIGDGSVTDGYIDGASFATASSGFSWVTTFNEATPNTTADGMSLGKYYSAADTIDIVKKSANATTGGVVRLFALVIDCNPTISATASYSGS